MIRMRNLASAANEPQMQVPQPEEGEKMSLADDIRQRMAARKRGEPLPNLPPVGSPFFLFSKGDLIVLLIILAVVYVVVLVEHKVDLAHVAWIKFLRPNYDADHWL